MTNRVHLQNEVCIREGVLGVLVRARVCVKVVGGNRKTTRLNSSLFKHDKLT
jgi:hypothetical protein